jgi:hypothetical protein
MISQPDYPDPKVTAAAQSGMNRDTAITQQQLNMVNQVTPDGSLTYQQTGESGFTDSQGNYVATPTYTATTQLSDSQKAIKDQTDAASLNLGTIANNQSDFLKNYLGAGIDTSGAPELQTSIGNGFSGNIGGSYRDTIGGNYTTDLGPDWQTSYAGADDFSADRQRVVDAIKARAAPDIEANRRGLETQLIGRGLRPGTAAWDSEMSRLSKAENDFNLGADLAGGQEQSRLVGMARDAAQFGNDATLTRASFGNNAETTRFGAENAAALTAATMRNQAAAAEAQQANAARQQYLQELFATRNQPINEISALLSGAQVQNPQFNNTPSSQVGGVDYTGLVNEKYKADVQANSSMMGGLFGLLSAPFAMFSDRRLKRDIDRVKTLENGLGWYRFRYIWDKVTEPFREGVMADEVRRILPSAVIPHESGFDMVNYDLIGEAA